MTLCWLPLKPMMTIKMPSAITSSPSGFTVNPLVPNGRERHHVAPLPAQRDSTNAGVDRFPVHQNAWALAPQGDATLRRLVLPRVSHPYPLGSDLVLHGRCTRLALSLVLPIRTHRNSAHSLP